MSNKLKEIFSSDVLVADKGIKRIVNQAYDMQWCTTCKNSYFETSDPDAYIKCRISQRLIKERRWSPVDNSEQYCLFYEVKDKNNGRLN